MFRVSSKPRVVDQHKVNPTTFCGIFVSSCSVWGGLFLFVRFDYQFCVFWVFFIFRQGERKHKNVEVQKVGKSWEEQGQGKDLIKLYEKIS